MIDRLKYFDSTIKNWEGLADDITFILKQPQQSSDCHNRSMENVND